MSESWSTDHSSDTSWTDPLAASSVMNGKERPYPMQFAVSSGAAILSKKASRFRRVSSKAAVLLA